MPNDPTTARAIEAVVFDLDGVLIASEAAWSSVREAVTTESGGRWHDRAQADMMGMSSTEWSVYMHEELGVPHPPERISEEVTARLERLFRNHLPLLPGAEGVVRSSPIAGRSPSPPRRTGR